MHRRTRVHATQNIRALHALVKNSTCGCHHRSSFYLNKHCNIDDPKKSSTNRSTLRSDSSRKIRRGFGHLPLRNSGLSQQNQSRYSPFTLSWLLIAPLVCVSKSLPHSDGAEKPALTSVEDEVVRSAIGVLPLVKGEMPVLLGHHS